MIRSLGGYDVLLQLKTGGMGEVLLARRKGAGGFEKLAAIKTIRGELRDHEELRRMFLDEAQLLARLGHPGIAQVHDFGEQDGELYLVMEYVEGIRFRQLAALRPPPGVAARAMAAACRGLHAAHELRDLSGRELHVVHRDLTPENLMLGFGGEVKVLDFGIALARGRQAPVTELGTIKGKPPYLSPEQLRSEALDRRTDIYSAGLVLHELLTGEPVFTGESVYQVARAIEHEAVPPPSRAAGPLPAGLDDIALRAVAKDRDARYATAGELADALERVADADGAPELHDYARDALADDRERHRVWLRDLLTSSALAGGPRGRASGVMTVPLVEPSEPEDDERRRRSWAPAVIALALAGIAAVALLAVDREDEPQSVAAVADLDAAPPAPPPVVVVAESPPDAAPAPTPPDAAPVIVRKRKPPPPEPVNDPQPLPDEPAGFGLLTIAAEPYALVRIDGKEIGTTPIFNRKLPVGDHEVVLVSPDTGAVRLRKTVRITKDAHERVVAR